MDIIIVNHALMHVYTNCREALEGIRREDIEKVYQIDTRYKFVYCINMRERMSGTGEINLIKIEDVRRAAVLIVEIFY